MSEEETVREAGVADVMALLEIRGQCSMCGWIYGPYKGHLEPCPRCALQQAWAVIDRLLDQISIRDLACANRELKKLQGMVRPR